MGYLPVCAMEIHYNRQISSVVAFLEYCGRNHSTFPNELLIIIVLFSTENARFGLFRDDVGFFSGDGGGVAAETSAFGERFGGDS